MENLGDHIDNAIDVAAARLGYEEVSEQREAVRALVSMKRMSLFHFRRVTESLYAMPCYRLSSTACLVVLLLRPSLRVATCSTHAGPEGEICTKGSYC